MDWSVSEYLALGIRVLLAGVFLYAAVRKLGAGFPVEAFSRLTMMPLSLARLVAPVIPLLEMSLAVALLLGVFPIWTLVLSISLLGVFTLVLSAAAARGIQEGCGCFGDLDERPPGLWQIARNLSLLLLAGIAVLAGPDPIATEVTDSFRTGFVDQPALVSLVLLGAVISLLVSRQIGATLKVIRESELSREKPYVVPASHDVRQEGG